MELDKKLTEDIEQWLNSEDPDILFGAQLLLKLNRNRILYGNICNRPEKHKEKLIYELKKYLVIRKEGHTCETIDKMSSDLLPKVETYIAKNVGKREDHDQLPQEIAQLYDVNGDLYQKIKKVFNDLKEMENAPACDRYEYLKILSDLDHKYRENYAKYDNYKLGDDLPKEDNTGNESETITSKSITAARKYISINKKKLEENAQEDVDEKLFNKMQEKINLICKAGETFDKKYQTELEDLGFIF